MLGAITQIGFDGSVFAGGARRSSRSLGADTVAGTMTYSELYLPSIQDAAPPRIQENLQAYSIG